jgi:hypothetical protein
MSKTIYIAGPMRGIKWFNFPAFDAARGALGAAGWVVASPADMDRRAGLDPFTLPPDRDWNTLPDGYDFDEIRRRDLAAVMSADAIYMLPGWSRGKGARAEFAVARWWEKEVLYAEGAECVDAGQSQGTKPTNPKDAIGSDKLPLHLWPTTATAMGCIGMLNGMLKYGRSNFRAVGVRASIYYDAARRHLDAWFEGEADDPDDGVPHLAAALSCLAIIVDAEAAGKLTDDRMVPGDYRKLADALTPHVKRLKALHASRTPKHWTIADQRDGGGK